MKRDRDREKEHVHTIDAPAGSGPFNSLQVGGMYWSFCKSTCIARLSWLPFVEGVLHVATATCCNLLELSMECNVLSVSTTLHYQITHNVAGDGNHAIHLLFHAWGIQISKATVVKYNPFYIVHVLKKLYFPGRQSWVKWTSRQCVMWWTKRDIFILPHPWKNRLW